MDQLQEEICTCVPGGVCFRSLSPSPLAEEKGTVQILWGKVNDFIVNNAFGSIGQNIVIGVGIQFVFYLWARKIENQKLKRKAEEKLERNVAEEQSNNERIQREADLEKRLLDKLQAVQDLCEAVPQISRLSNYSNASLQRAQKNASTEICATEESCSTAAYVTIDMRAILAAQPSESQWRALQTAHNTTATGYKGSHIFQITIPFREGELCDKLDELQQTLESEGDNSSDHHPTLQLGHWGIFDRDTKQLKPFVEEADAGRRLTVPNILMCTRLSHDKIAIFGVDLKADEATRVYAATAQQKHLLDIAWDRDEIVIKDVSASRGIAS